MQDDTRLRGGALPTEAGHAIVEIEDHGHAGAHGEQVYAALDLGTNNCRLLVARATRDGFRVIDAFSRIIRLGEGITSSGRLSEAAIVRAVEALRVCRSKMRNRGVTRSRLIATEACRAAANGLDFLATVKEQVGIDLEIVDRETEARLAATGCTPLADPEAEGVILFDIGGGSSELVRLSRCVPTKRGPPLPDINAWVSIPIGVVTLAEHFGGKTVDAHTFAAMKNHARDALRAFAESTAEAVRCPRFHLLGTSGTLTTLAGIKLGLRRYERSRIDGPREPLDRGARQLQERGAQFRTRQRPEQGFELVDLLEVLEEGAADLVRGHGHGFGSCSVVGQFARAGAPQRGQGLVAGLDGRGERLERMADQALVELHRSFPP